MVTISRRKRPIWPCDTSCNLARIRKVTQQASEFVKARRRIAILGAIAADNVDATKGSSTPCPAA
jgi:hypothetical protein